MNVAEFNAQPGESVSFFVPQPRVLLHELRHVVGVAGENNHQLRAVVLARPELRRREASRQLCFGMELPGCPEILETSPLK